MNEIDADNDGKWYTFSIKNNPQFQHRFSLWIKLIIMITFSVSVCSFVLLQTWFTGIGAVMVACLCLIPGIIAQQMFDIDYDAFLMDYEVKNFQTVTDLQYYSQILNVLVNGPLLAVNILALTINKNNVNISNNSTSDEKEQLEDQMNQYQSARILIVASVLFLFVFIYYSFFDRYLVPTRMSIFKNFNTGSDTSDDTKKSDSNNVEKSFIEKEKFEKKDVSI